MKRLYELLCSELVILHVVVTGQLSPEVIPGERTSER
jgi:hypothetical protein